MKLERICIHQFLPSTFKLSIAELKVPKSELQINLHNFAIP